MSDPEGATQQPHFFLGVGPDDIQFSTNMHFKAYLKKKAQKHNLRVILMIMLNHCHYKK